jgi:hypothetical protein
VVKSISAIPVQRGGDSWRFTLRSPTEGDNLGRLSPSVGDRNVNRHESPPLCTGIAEIDLTTPH